MNRTKRSALISTRLWQKAQMGCFPKWSYRCANMNRWAAAIWTLHWEASSMKRSIPYRGRRSRRMAHVCYTLVEIVDKAHESEFQVLMRIQGLVARSQHPNWDDIKKVIHRTKPLCSQATPYMFTFLMKFGRPEMLQSLEKRTFFQYLPPKKEN